MKKTEKGACPLAGCQVIFARRGGGMEAGVLKRSGKEFGNQVQEFHRTKRFFKNLVRAEFFCK